MWIRIGLNRYGSVDATTLCCLRRIVLHSYIFCVVLVLSFFSSNLSADVKIKKGKIQLLCLIPTCIIFRAKKNREPTDPWIQGVKPMRIHADLDSDTSQTLKSQKDEFSHEVIGHKTYLQRYKSLFDRQETKFTVFVDFGPFAFSWIRIRIPNTDPGTAK